LHPFLRGRSGRATRRQNVAIFLIHRPGDSVGVATADLTAGAAVTGRYRDIDDTVELTANSDIPLGHKIAVSDLPEGTVVIEYGEEIGVTKADVAAGDHVHVHNMKGQRWA
jgi:(2R)-sulfolactate sulfo-lyase subunit alpha